MRKFFGLLLSVLCLSQLAKAQDFSNRGKDFWIAYPSHIDGTASVMGLYITSDQNASGTIKVGATTIAFTVTANTITRKFLGPNAAGDAPNTGVHLTTQDGIEVGKGIRVTSDKPVVVYAHIIRSARSGATLALPVTVLSKEYIIPSYRNVGSGGANAGFGEVAVVATDTNTVVEITPSVTSRSGTRAAGVPYTITLANPGDVYQVQFQQNADISGTIVRSVAVNGVKCKKIAVFSATTWSAFDCTTPVASGGDNLFQQPFPTTSWGKSFLTAPFFNNSSNRDIIRVFVKDPSTVVQKTEAGVTTTLTGLIAGSYYEYTTGNPTAITADKPASVVMYIRSQNCQSPATNTDPEMVIINPVEQTINDITVFSAHQNFVPTGQSQVTNHYLNIIIKTAAAASFRISGVAPTGTFIPIPGTQYSYLREDVSTKSASNPVHSLKADSAFIAIAYGFGNVESYGYNAGTNVKDLFQFIDTKNALSTAPFPAACVNSPFNFSITFPYLPDSIRWDFGTLFPALSFSSPVPDSSYSISGRMVYRFKVTQSYSAGTAGTYPVKVYARNPLGDGCSSDQEIEFDLQIFNPPTTDFTYTTSGCTDSAVVFTSNTNSGGRPIIKHYWDFGDGTTGNTANPSKTYLNPGTFTVKYVALTDIGCISDTVTKTITLTKIPVAKFGILDSLCIGKVLTFRDSSTLAGGFGTITNWNWSTGVGGPINNTSSADVTATYAATGNYTASLQLRTNTGCYSPVYQKSIIIRPKPTVDFNLSHGCLPNPVINFTNTSTIADGTQAGFAYAWNFGDAASGALNSSTIQNPSHAYPSAGPFNVQLKITSQYGCIDSVTKVADKIYPQPKADFSAPAEVCWQTPITFTDASNGFMHPVVKWEWRFSDGTTSTQKSPVKNFTNPGTYTATLWVFTDQNCVSDTVIKTVVVNPWPTAGFSMSALQCEKNAITFTSTSVANAGNIIRSYWDFGDGNTANVTTLSTTHTYTNWGNYTVRFVTETDKGCRNDTLLKPVLVNPLPKVDFTISHGCLPNPVINFTNTSTIADGTQAGFVYAWNFGDAASGALNSSTIQNPSHAYPSAGPFNVQLKITSQYGCIDSITKVADKIYPQPKADFTAPAEVCWQTPITFTDASNGFTHPVVKWEWRFSDGTTSTQKSPVKNFTNPGTYTATLWVFTDQNCVSDTVVKTVVVNPWPTASFTTSAILCEKNVLTLTNTSVANAGNITRTYWDFGDGNTADVNSLSTTHTYTNWGNYTVRFVTETDKGCRNDTLLQPVTINPLPKPGYVLPEVCLNDALALFLDTSSIADNSAAQLTYLWKFNTGTPAIVPGPLPATSTLKNPAIKFNKADNYLLSLTVTSKDGCKDSVVAIPFTVNGSIPNADFTILTTNGQCSNQDIQIKDNSTVDFGAVTKVEIYWDNANAPAVFETDDVPTPGKIYNHRYPDFQTPLTKTYQIRYKAYSGILCVDEQIRTITINASPLTQFNPLNAVCVNDNPLQITQARELGGLAGTGVYSGRGVNGTGLFNPATAGVGVHTLRYTFTAANGCVHYSEQTIEVWPKPDVNAGPDLTVLEDGIRKITDVTVTGTGLQFLWTPATYLDSDTIQLPTIIGPKDDVTYVLTVTNSFGCKATDDLFMKVLKAPRPPNTFTPNGDGINDFWEIKFMNDYPGAVIEVYNTAGSLVYRSVGYSTPWDGKWKGQPLPAGTYYYVLDPKNGRKRISGYVTILR
jgi:gliding motility-associated-like protein